MMCKLEVLLHLSAALKLLMLDWRGTISSNRLICSASLLYDMGQLCLVQLLNIFACELQRLGTAQRLAPSAVFAALQSLFRRCRGGYAVVALLYGHGVVGFRDAHGIRPLVMGKRETARGTEWMLASESVALDLAGFTRVRDVEPGEAVYIEADGAMHAQRVH